MEKHYIYLVVGVLIGGLGGTFFGRNSVSTETAIQPEQVTMNQHDMHGMSMSMGEMSMDLESLSGDAFDKRFLELMIDHHQGAIDMANLVLEKSEKEELINLANEIISAQTKEIDMMRGWMEAWGY